MAVERVADTHFMGSIQLDSRERAFVAAALRRSVTQSYLVIGFAILTTACGLVGTIAYMDSPRSMEARFAFAFGGVSLLCGVLAMLSARHRKRRSALLAIHRCGCCGHPLRGSKKPLTATINAKTCMECGTVWTDLDRRDSISMIYECV
jgi:hypothetical protein